MRGSIAPFRGWWPKRVTCGRWTVPFVDFTGIECEAARYADLRDAW